MSQTSHQEGDRQPNRLARETSPYLLQHQFNPVDWYPWGEEAVSYTHLTLPTNREV